MNRQILTQHSAQVNPLTLHASAVIKQHSRSFSLASQLLPATVRSSVNALYAWCRTVDDAVDEASSPAEAERVLDMLESDLDRMVRGETPLHSASDWLKPLVHARRIEVVHAKELIEGMRMDLRGVAIHDDKDLYRYAYHAAGTVGLMMTRLMGVREPAADRHAIALGVAMQLTNIARDVHEDAVRGRSYLPGIDEPLKTDANRVQAAVAKVLETAEREYEIAAAGLKYLPRNCRFAIRMALALYREIGRQIVRNDCRVLTGRTVLSKPRLVGVIAKTLFTSIVDECLGVLRAYGRNAFSDLFSQPATELLPRVFNLPSLFQEPTMNHSKVAQASSVSQAKHAVYLGLSLTSIMAAALFVMVYVNPKDTSYAYLPLVYAAGSLVSGVFFNRLAARCERSQATSIKSC